MPKFFPNECSVTLNQWNRPGDLPALVQPYKRDDVDNTLPCHDCGSLMKNHGWIDPPEPATDVPAGSTVNPVTGELVAPPPPSEWPKVYEKKGDPNRIVDNAEEEKQALADKYHLAQVSAPPRVPPAHKKGDDAKAGSAKAAPERGDLEGLVVHPGNWAGRVDKTGEAIVRSKEVVALNYTRQQ